MSDARSIAVRIQGQEYRIRSEADDASVQRLARYVDATMDRVRERTHTVDSRAVAVLSALNIARDLLALRESGVVGDGALRVESARVESLIELIDDAEQG